MKAFRRDSHPPSTNAAEHNADEHKKKEKKTKQ
jgi:hypothetical protein